MPCKRRAELGMHEPAAVFDIACEAWLAKPEADGRACVQLVASVLVWENCWYFMPSAADEDPILRVSAH